MGILLCVYTGLLNMLQVRYWVTAYFTFCPPTGAVEPVSIVLVYSAHWSNDFYKWMMCLPVFKPQTSVLSEDVMQSLVASASRKQETTFIWQGIP